jgi:hypothetical protein
MRIVGGLMKFMNNIANYMIKYCYVDTCILSDILIQYNPLYSSRPLKTSKFLRPNMLNEINNAIESSGDNGMIITSSFAFIELINKFNEIFTDGHIQPYTIHNFIKQPPLWITIEDLNDKISWYIGEVPQNTPKMEPISGDDAIHLATAISRGEPITFCTTDTRMNQLKIKNITFLTN